MRLGPAALLCAFADKVHSGIRGILTTFGRVPFAFYIAHIALIHTLSVLLGVTQGFRASQLMTLFLFYPQGYGVSLLRSKSRLNSLRHCVDFCISSTCVPGRNLLVTAS